jgi:hypothetical protein
MMQDSPAAQALLAGFLQDAMLMTVRLSYGRCLTAVCKTSLSYVLRCKILYFGYWKMCSLPRLQESTFLPVSHGVSSWNDSVLRVIPSKEVGVF